MRTRICNGSKGKGIKQLFKLNLLYNLFNCFVIRKWYQRMVFVYVIPIYTVSKTATIINALVTTTGTKPVKSLLYKTIYKEKDLTLTLIKHYPIFQNTWKKIETWVYVKFEYPMLFAFPSKQIKVCMSFAISIRRPLQFVGMRSHCSHCLPLCG